LAGLWYFHEKAEDWEIEASYINLNIMKMKKGDILTASWTSTRQKFVF